MIYFSYFFGWLWLYLINIDDTKAGNTCIWSTYARGSSAYIRVVFVKSAYIRTSYIGGRILIFWDDCICRSTNDSCKFTVLGLRFGMSGNCYLYLQMFLDKVSYYPSTQLIYSRVHLLFHSISVIFNIIVVWVLLGPKL